MSEASPMTDRHRETGFEGFAGTCRSSTPSRRSACTASSGWPPAFRLFGRFGFDEGVAGHITARDPEHLDHFWVNPFGMNFSHIRVSDLILVNDKGEVVEGDAAVNGAAFAIHSQVHAARPDVIAAAHSHSIYGKSWSSLGRLLDPLTQDACAFYEDHALFDDYTGVVLDPEEGKRIAHALGERKAVILRNHGLLTVGHSVDEAVWWFITMERSCQAQLLAEAAGTPVLIDADMAAPHRDAGRLARRRATLSFQPLYQKIIARAARPASTDASPRRGRSVARRCCERAYAFVPAMNALGFGELARDDVLRTIGDVDLERPRVELRRAPARPSPRRGARRRRHRQPSSLSGRWNSSVSITPGFTTWTPHVGVARGRLPSTPTNAVSAALVAVYAASPGGPRRAATDEMFTIRPPRSMSSGSSASVRRMGEK